MNSFDSGKTILSRNLAEFYVNNGHAVEYFKPISGHNYWYRNEHTQNCIADSILASRDAYLVRSILNSRIPLEIANPIHSLFVPAVLQQPTEVISSTLAVGGWDSILAIQRYSLLRNGRISSTTLLAEELINSGKLLLTQEEADSLTRDTQVIPFNSMGIVEEYAKQNLEYTLDAAIDAIEKDSEILLIEGFNNSSWLWEGLEWVDNILVTGPGHVYSYDPDRFRKAVFLVKYGSQPIREVPFSRVSDMIKPIGVVHLRPQQGLTTQQLNQLSLNGKE